MKAGKKRKCLNVLITAGPTQEMIDPVRFISNRSTGVMGYEIAKAALKKGHKVTLISGPVNIKPPKGVRFVEITSAEELKKATLFYLKEADCLFMAAAVSDWRAASFKSKKVKRTSRGLRIALKPTPDILAFAGKKKGNRILIGFSVETEGALVKARAKLKKKNLDMIVVNRLDKHHNPFGNRKIISAVIYKNGRAEELPLSGKKDIAIRLIDNVEKLR